MRKLIVGKFSFCLIGLVLFLAGCVAGRETASRQKTILHIFAYTPLEGATQKDYEDFKKATGEMVGKVPGLRKVWVGKLREPMLSLDKFRTFGAAMEFDDAQALDAYAGNPVHREWEQIYEKVRAQGTTTLDIVSE